MIRERTCPGCGLVMPVRDQAVNTSYFNASPECWLVYTEVLGVEYSNGVLFGQVHQLTVDAYAVQHAGGVHPDKSVGVHLSGLYLVLEQRHRPTTVPPLLQRLAASVQSWPRFTAPRAVGLPTVLDVALAGGADDHIEQVRRWAAAVWRSWSAYHMVVASIVLEHLTVPRKE